MKLQLTADALYDINTFTRKWRELSGSPEGTKTLSVQNAPAMVDALRIELRASDDTVLTLAGDAIKTQLSIMPAVSGIEDNLEPGQPQLFMELTAQGSAVRP
nr:hypothetical protein [uncultured Desulfobacter sp.]